MGTVVNSSADKLFFHNLDNLKPTMQAIKGITHTCFLLCVLGYIYLPIISFTILLLINYFN